MEYTYCLAATHIGSLSSLKTFLKQRKGSSRSIRLVDIIPVEPKLQMVAVSCRFLALKLCHGSATETGLTN